MQRSLSASLKSFFRIIRLHYSDLTARRGKFVTFISRCSEKKINSYCQTWILVKLIHSRGRSSNHTSELSPTLSATRVLQFLSLEVVRDTKPLCPGLGSFIGQLSNQHLQTSVWYQCAGPCRSEGEKHGASTDTAFTHTLPINRLVSTKWSWEDCGVPVVKNPHSQTMFPSLEWKPEPKRDWDFDEMASIHGFIWALWTSSGTSDVGPRTFLFDPAPPVT